MKILPKITENSRKLVLRDIYRSSGFFSMEKFLQGRIRKDSYFLMPDGNRIDEYILLEYIRDYIDMSREARRKINLCFLSAKKLRDAHDDLAILIANKFTPAIKIPDNSCFKNIRNVLPDNFEWIKTRRRIILEGSNMHHCVASYASHINLDKSAIYSLQYMDKKRYTIEFGISRNKYYVKQIHGVWNTSAPDDVINYVESFIKK